MLFCTEKFLAMGEIFQKPSDGKRSSFSVAQGKDDIPMEGGNGFLCRHLIGNPLQNQTGQKADPKTAFHNGENGVIIPSSKTDIGRKTFSAEKSAISAFLSFSSIRNGSLQRASRKMHSACAKGCVAGRIARKSSRSRKIVSKSGRTGRQRKPQSTRPSRIHASISR